MGNRAIGVWVRPGREISVLFLIFGVVSACGRPPEVEAPTDAAPPPGWDGVTPLFRDATAAWGLDGINAAGVRVSSLDLDDDGWPDLQVRALTSGENPSAGVRNTWVLRNDGAGHFVDQTEASGVPVGRVGPRSAPVWAVGDLNGDDVLDLFTGRPNPGTGERSELLIGGSDGAFTLALPQGFSFDPQDNPFGASFADVDRDGHLDLWVDHGAVGGAPRAS